MKGLQVRNFYSIALGYTERHTDGELGKRLGRLNCKDSHLNLKDSEELAHIRNVIIEKGESQGYNMILFAISVWCETGHLHIVSWVWHVS